MSGYQLKRAIEQSTGNFWRESYGQIYPMLQRLVDDGLATKEERASAGGRPANLYTITDRGRATLESWLREPPNPRPPRNELLLKLFFAGRTELAVSIEHVRAERETAAAEMARYEILRRELEAHHAANPELPFWLMTLDYGLHASRARVAWCEATLERLASQPEPQPSKQEARP